MAALFVLLGFAVGWWWLRGTERHFTVRVAVTVGVDSLGEHQCGAGP